jgi:hypothetical protein
MAGGANVTDNVRVNFLSCLNHPSIRNHLNLLRQFLTEQVSSSTREEPSLNFGLEIDSSKGGISWIFSVPRGKGRESKQIGNDSLLPYPFKFHTQ